jgi:hypothetical protein
LCPSAFTSIYFVHIYHFHQTVHPADSNNSAPDNPTQLRRLLRLAANTSRVYHSLPAEVNLAGTTAQLLLSIGASSFPRTLCSFGSSTLSRFFFLAPIWHTKHTLLIQ